MAAERQEIATRRREAELVLIRRRAGVKPTEIEDFAGQKYAVVIHYAVVIDVYPTFDHQVVAGHAARYIARIID